MAGRVVLAAAMLIPTTFPLPASAQQDDTDSDSGPAPLFASRVPLSVTIEAPLTTLMRERPEDEYLDAAFSFTGDDGIEHALDLKIRVRGKFRLQEDICEFAPIRLNFKKKQLAGTVFAGQDKLKLVTHCQSGKTKYEPLVFREYVAYRILQVMTDVSFGVRLLKIDYVDTDRDKSMTKYGFVIEDDDDVAERLGMETVKISHVRHADLEPRQENLVNVFQYLVGNTDFSLVKAVAEDDCCHNAVLLSVSDGPPYMPVPYDFDFTGIVNAPYAAPNPRFKLRGVRQRLYRGQCRNNALLADTFDHFMEKKTAIYATVDEIGMLEQKHRSYIIRYLDSFFEDITEPKTINRRFIDKCN
jgi:hypothetical protein